MTKYEKLIYDIINGSNEHLTASMIFERLQEEYSKVVLATVYNNLNKLCEAGLIRMISVEGMPDRYDRVNKHDHLICKNCGKISDVNFNDLTKSLQKQMGEGFLHYDLKVYYLCPSCVKENK